jgi:hypothetical protein
VQIATLLIVGWLPGAALFHAPLLDRDRRAALDPEERTFWAVVLSLAISVSAVLALAALQRYTFTRLLAVDLTIVAAALALWGRRLRMRGAKRVTLTAVIPVMLMVLAGWRFFPPAEYIIGGRDPGVYMNEGIQIAQRGSLVVNDPVVAAVPGFARDLFLPRHLAFDGTPRTDYYSLRFMGFFIRNPDTGAVVGQFPHLFPASIAIGYGIDGLTGARRATGVWALLGIMAVYFAGSRLLGRPAAAAAAALLTLHVVQVWFARYPNAEVVMQAFLFAAVLASARAHVDGDRFFAPVAGLLLGLLLFLRFDAVLGVAAVSGAAALGIFAGQRPHAAFVAVLTALAVLAAAYMAGPLRAYAQRPFEFFQRIYQHTSWWQYALALAPALVLAGALVVIRRRLGSARFATLALTGIPATTALVLVIAAGYALLLRHPAGKLAAHDAYALRTFADVYFTVPGVLGALLGFWLLARNRFWRDPAMFVTVVVFAMFVFYKLRVVPEHFWMARRFLPVILPGALLFLCAAVFATETSHWRWRILRWAVGGTLLVLLASTYLRSSAQVVHHTEYEGLIPRLEALAERFADGDLVIVESRNAGGDVHVLATPLAYIYARNVLLLASPRPDKAAVGSFVEWARTRYERVFFIGGGGTDLLSHRYGLRAVANQRFQVPEFESTTDALPRTVRQKEFEFGVYQFLEAPAGDAGWFELDVGANDDLHLLRFHARERSDGRTFRWTGATSYVAVTTIKPAARELTLVLNDGGRPPAAPPARVEVFLHNQRLGAIDPSPGGFRPYVLQIPSDLARRAADTPDPVELRLVSSLWNPRDVLGVPDDRDLGVMLDRVTIK